MEFKVVNAGNCIVCGKPIISPARRGSNKLPEIFFCKSCLTKIEERREPMTEDVVEREKIDKAVDEMEDLVYESLSDAPCTEMQFRCGLIKAIEILEKNEVYKRDFKDLYIAVDRKESKE